MQWFEVSGADGCTAQRHGPQRWLWHAKRGHSAGVSLGVSATVNSEHNTEAERRRRDGQSAGVPKVNLNCEDPDVCVFLDDLFDYISIGVSFDGDACLTLERKDLRPRMGCGHDKWQTHGLLEVGASPGSSQIPFCGLSRRPIPAMDPVRHATVSRVTTLESSDDATAPQCWPREQS